MAAAPVRRWPGAALPSSSLHWLMKKLGEEGPGQDLHASCLSMNQVEIKFLFYLYDAIPFLEDCFHEPPKDWSHVPRSHSKITMSVPVLNQSSSAPFQAIIGITSKTFYSLQS
uniref:Uncharacterized protein n=1 Tax=Oryza rufipogon TaxID=4529 RepID=A0A0E0Q727_ORYRU